MATVNPNIAGAGFSSGSVAGNQSISVTGANDFNWVPGNGFQTALTLVAQGAGTINSADLFNQFWRGMKVVVDITAITGTGPSLTVAIQGKESAIGKYFTILASAALTAVGTTVLTVYPGLVAAANLIANDHHPVDWRVQAVVAGAGPSVTATIGVCSLI